MCRAITINYDHDPIPEAPNHPPTSAHDRVTLETWRDGVSGSGWTVEDCRSVVSGEHHVSRYVFMMMELTLPSFSIYALNVLIPPR